MMNWHPFSSTYAGILASRFASGELLSFNCAGCKQRSLDPVGSNESGFLCSLCADPEPVPDDEPKPDISRFHRGNRTFFERVANIRHLDIRAVILADNLGTLRFGKVCGFLSWILTDSSGLCAEGRRLDGKVYPSSGQLGLRKVHTIRNSRKNWAVGILPNREFRDSHATIAAVEGGPDYLGILHFAVRQNRRILPVAILGRGACRALCAGCLTHFRGRRVRLFPHADADGGGVERAVNWARQLERIGCDVDLFDFRGLRKADGTPIVDVNDCTQIVPEQATELEGLLP
jgi:hypothetical protein